MKPPLRVLVAVLLLTVAPRPAAAAEALAPGSWSVQFSVQPNLTLGSFQGSALSLKRHLAGGRAIRLGLSFSVTDNGNDLVQAVSDTTLLGSNANRLDVNVWSVGLSSYYFWYSGSDAPLRAFWGAGPFVNISGGGSDRVDDFVGPVGASSRTTRQDLSGWATGLAAALGVEWQVASRVGVFAEYGSSLSYASSEETRRSVQTSPSGPDRTETVKLDDHRFQFGSTGGRLGISAYF